MYARRPLPVLVAAALGVAAGGALAEPAGPAVLQGSATVVNAARVTTITPATASTLIRWQGFNLVPGDTARFNQAAGGTVFNQVVPGGAFALGGSLESAGRVVFLNGSVATGAGLGIAGMNLDLAALNRSTLKLERADAAAPIRAPQETLAGQALATLSEGRVFVLGEDKASVSTSASGAVLLAPGRTVQLADVRYPNLRVEIAAPAGGSLDLSALLARSGQIFASLLSVRNAPGRRSESPAVQLADKGATEAMPLVYALAAMSRTDAVEGLSRELLALIPDPAAVARADALRLAIQQVLDEPAGIATAAAPAPAPAAPVQVAAAAPIVAIGLDEDRAALPALLAARLRSTEELQAPAMAVAAVGPEEDAMRLPALAGWAAGESVQAPVLVAALGPDEDRGALPASWSARLLAIELHEPSVPDIVAVGPDEDRLALPASVQSRLASTEVLQQPALVAVAVLAAPLLVAEAAPVPALAASPVPAPAPAIVAAAAAVPVPAAPQPKAVAPVPVASVALAEVPRPSAPAPATSAATSAATSPAPSVAAPAPAVQLAVVSQPVVPVPASVASAAAAAADGGPVRLARVERRLPMIMIDRKGGIFHM